MSNVKNVPAAEVRTWARTQPEFAGQAWVNERARGVIPEAGADAFRKAHKGRKAYVAKVAESAMVEVPGVVGIDKAGRKTSRTVTIPASEARVLIGEATSKRGRISKALVAAALSAENANAVADTFTK